MNLTRLTLAATAAAVAVAVLLPPVPAAASGPPLVRERDASAHDRAPVKTAVATCPSGRALLGTGGHIVAGQGGVRLAALVPDATLTSVTARGEALPGYTEPWSVVAIAICGRPPIFHQRVASPSLSPVATCPQDLPVVMGTGFALAGAPEQARLTGLVPDPVGGTVTVQVAFTGPVRAIPTAYAICGWAETERRKATSASDLASPKTAVAPGHPMTGVGGTLTGATADVFIDALVPAPGLDAVAVRATSVFTGAGARLAADDETGWAVTAYGLATADYY